jgi:hypothetical protein
MTPSDILPTIAEISVAIVGFAGILFALGNQGATDNEKMNLFRIRIMVETGMLMIFLSLTPVLFLSIPILAPFTWRLSSLMLAVLIPTYTLLSFHRQFRLIGKYVESKLDFTVSLVQLPTIALLLMVAFEWGDVPPFGTYLFGLFFWLGISIIMFVRIILDSVDVSQSGK